MARRWVGRVARFGIVAFAAVGMGRPGHAASDPWSAIAGAVRRGDDHGALRLVSDLPRPERSTAQARYLTGRLLDRLGRLGAALRAFDAVPAARLPAPVAADLARRRAMLLARTGQCGRAKSKLDALASSASAADGAVLQAMAAECAVQTGDLSAAESALREVIDRDAPGVDTFAASMELAEVLEREGQHDAARSELHDLLVSRPEHPDAARAEAQLAALGATPTFTTNERMDRAARLIRFGRYDEALAELDRAGHPVERQERQRWMHLRGQAMYRTRRMYAEASQVLDRAARLARGTDSADAFLSARALARAGLTSKGVRALRRFVQRYPTDPLAAQAQYLAALLELRAGKRAGRLHMAKFLEGRRASANPQLELEARWELAFTDFEAGRFRLAAKELDRYAQAGSDPLVRARGLYWKGRALEGAGDRNGAAEAYRAAMAVQALHYYAVLAGDRLRALGLPPAAPPANHGAPSAPGASSASDPPAPPVVQLPETARFYAALGLVDDARDALRRREATVVAKAPAGRGFEALVEAYMEVNAPSRAYRLVIAKRSDALAPLPTPESRWVWDAAYPHPFSADVDAAAHAYGVPTALIRGVMRQESGFDPEAVSYAGAIGLMQLMPATAHKLSPEADRTRLFDPRFNLRLGAQLLGHLLEEFHGSEPLAVAAYNAGDDRVHHWLAEAEAQAAGRPKGGKRAKGAEGGNHHAEQAELDLLVERIPIDQTRNYVRRVMSHYARYQYLAGDPDPGFRLSLPAP